MHGSGKASVGCGGGGGVGLLGGGVGLLGGGVGLLVVFLGGGGVGRVGRRQHWANV